MTYYPIDEMKIGESVTLRVYVQTPYADKWKPATAVDVTREESSWYYVSQHCDTRAAVDDSANPGHRGMNEHVKAACGAPYAIRTVCEADLLKAAYGEERRPIARLAREHKASGLYYDQVTYGCRAMAAIERAREKVARHLAGDAKALPSYSQSARIWSGLGGSDGAVSTYYGTRGRWIEDPESKGLRFIGLCSERKSRDACAWYIDAFQNETVSGVVYQLPAKDGRVRYLAGYADPHNCDKNGRGPAWLSLELIEGEAPDSSWDKPDCLETAYREADRIAERMAEEAREYDEAWQAGREFAELAESIAQERREIIALCREARAARKDGLAFPTICQKIRSSVRAALREIRKSRKERARLKSEFGSVAAFRDGVREGV